MKDQFSSCTARVNGFVERTERNAPRLQVRHHADQVLEAAPQPVQAPHRQRVTTA